MRELGVAATARASLYVYNDEADVDALADAIDAAATFFSPAERTGRSRRPDMPGLEDLYREIILDHYRSPRNRGELEAPPATRVEGFNPLCGDEIVLYVDVQDGTVADIRIGGQGCSISQSSASMMSAAVKGKTLDEVQALTRAFKAMMSIHEQSLDGDGADARRGRRPRREARRPRGAARRREVPRADQVRHAVVEHPAAGARRARCLVTDTPDDPRTEPRFGLGETEMLCALPRLPPRHAA